MFHGYGNIDLAINALEDGGVIVYPTDTLYGFGVDATNTEAIQRLNRLKGRVQPLSIVLESIDYIKNYAAYNPDLTGSTNIVDGSVSLIE